MDVEEDLIDLGESSKKNVTPSSIKNPELSSNDKLQEGRSPDIEVDSMETAQDPDVIDVRDRGVSIFNPADSQIPEAARGISHAPCTKLEPSR